VDSINSATQTISIGTANFIRDEETSRIVRAGGKKAAPFEINTNANIKTTGVVQSYDGDGDIDIFFSAKFKFK
jgi:hypothetical protein